MTGFRVKSPISGIFKALRSSVSAKDFSPEVKLFLKRSLTTAIQMTPARSLSLIKRNQKTQYQHRVDYIPSFHELLDPTLIVKSDGSQWLYTGQKWYRPDLWRLPNDVYDVYLELDFERQGRLETDRSDFIAFRAQARFLYKKSWWEIGQSIGVEVPCSQQVKDSDSRRSPSQLKNGHKQNPPKGYAIERGGKGVYSIIVVNPFLETQTQYWTQSGKQIIDAAMKQHRDAFDKKVAEKQRQLILRIIRALLS